jgi:hypothetical protein
VGRADREGLPLRPGTARLWVRPTVLKAARPRACRWLPPSRLSSFLCQVPRKASLSKRFASCSCGQLTAQVAGEPVRVSICHCLASQRRTGSTFGQRAKFRRDQVSVSGVSSGPGAKRAEAALLVDAYKRMSLKAMAEP